MYMIRTNRVFGMQSHLPRLITFFHERRIGDSHVIFELTEKKSKTLKSTIMHQSEFCIHPTIQDIKSEWMH